MGPVRLIFLVFCVVVIGGIYGVHLFSFLCCGVWWGPLCSSFWFSVLWCFVGSVVPIFLVFCVVVFGGGSVVLIFLVFCVVVFGGASGAHLFSFLCCSIW